MGLTAEAVQDRKEGTAVPLCGDNRRIRGRAETLEIAFATDHKSSSGYEPAIARTVGPDDPDGNVRAYAPVVAALAYAYGELSPWTALLFLAPALAAQRLFSLYQEKTRTTSSRPLRRSEGCEHVAT